MVQGCISCYVVGGSPFTLPKLTHNNQTKRKISLVLDLELIYVNEHVFLTSIPYLNAVFLARETFTPLLSLFQRLLHHKLPNTRPTLSTAASLPML